MSKMSTSVKKKIALQMFRMVSFRSSGMTYLQEWHVLQIIMVMFLICQNNLRQYGKIE